MKDFEEIVAVWDKKATTAVNSLMRRLYKRGFTCHATYNRGVLHTANFRLEMQVRGSSNKGPVLELVLWDATSVELAETGYLSAAFLWDAAGNKIGQVPQNGNAVSSLVHADKGSLLASLDEWLSEDFLYQFLGATLGLPAVEKRPRRFANQLQA